MPTALLQISEQQNDQALEVGLGGKVVVALGCNRSTGQTWSIVQPLPTELRADGDAAYNAPPRAGAWGEEVFTFVAAKTGSARLRMAYARPDDTAAKPGRTFGAIINVRGNGSDAAEAIATAAKPAAAAPVKAATKTKTAAPAKKASAKTKAAAPAKKAAVKKSATKKATSKKTSRS